MKRSDNSVKINHVILPSQKRALWLAGSIYNNHRDSFEFGIDVNGGVHNIYRIAVVKR